MQEVLARPNKSEHRPLLTVDICAVYSATTKLEADDNAEFSPGQNKEHSGNTTNSCKHAFRSDGEIVRRGECMILLLGCLLAVNPCQHHLPLHTPAGDEEERMML